MSDNAPILIATEAVADAELVATLLREEFGNILLSTKAEAAVADFEAHKPAILILAFDTLKQAEHYYLGLCRLSSMAPTIRHRTLILCNASELWKVYELCKQSHFDDYVLFWPASADAPRIRMAVHQLLRQIAQAPVDTVSAGELAAGAHSLMQSQEAIARHAAAGGERVDEATRALQLAQQGISTSLEDVAIVVQHAARRGEVDARGLQVLTQALDTVKSEALPDHLASASASFGQVREWVGDLAEQSASRVHANRSLQGLVEKFKPLVLIVDDDSYQHKLLQRVLADSPLRLMFAWSGLEALAMLRELRPDLVLMDVELPDITGIEATRRLQRIPHMKAVPVVMITGHSERSLVVECLKAGAIDFAVKPFQKATLLAKINSALAKPPVDGE